MKKIQLNHTQNITETGLNSGLLANEKGSVMVIVLMVLAIMTTIGVIGSDTVVTENFIIRNVGIHKQNIDIAESALMEGLQRFMQINDDDAANFAPTAAVWINSINANPAANPIADLPHWYEGLFTTPCLNVANSAVANLPMLADRGEAASNLRYAAVGWEVVQYAGGGGGSFNQANNAIMHEGRIVAEYVSSDGGGADNGNGLIRMEIGVRRKWKP